ncbi:hypothetical protein [Teichococcus oryzae]|uniref:Uncharacterized protein n=1 Tax=Teichococcus oryzae TaxID=1608942 RepID=A0A5B2TC41_9PROT|nr:hypothetical protein [Pseudoroseomonas oryzae]KAA2211408.1 hypothetical protein F0Q34_20275 [Pseudoroseomonas oryzae]
MRDLKVGIFFDGQKADHSYTVLGLKNAFERSATISECFALTPQDEAAHAALQQALAEPLASFDGVVLETDFAALPGCGGMVFLLDDAVRLNQRDWRESELDQVGTLSRVLAADIRAWLFFRDIFRREIPLIPAPLPSYAGYAPHKEQRVALIVNDLSLGEYCHSGIVGAIRSVRPEIDIIEIVNGYRAPAQQSAWLNPRLVNAAAHIHIGHPPDTVSAGRLIDSMNMRAPCIVFDDTFSRRDLGVTVPWRLPNYINDVNIVRTSSLAAFSTAVRVVLQDPAWSRNLIRNAGREVEDFQAQFQNTFLTPLTGELTAWQQV